MEAAATRSRTIHPLWSRIVFFLRDWSLTLYLLPFALAKPSYWFLFILPLGVMLDRELRSAVKRLVGTERSSWNPLGYLSAYPRLTALLVLISASLMAVFGVKAIAIVTGFWLAVGLVFVCFDPGSKMNVRARLPVMPRYGDGQVQYPGLITGPISLILFVELNRIGAVLAVGGGGTASFAMFAAALLGCVIVVCYWVGAFFVAINDEIRAGSVPVD